MFQEFNKKLVKNKKISKMSKDIQQFQIIKKFLFIIKIKLDRKIFIKMKSKILSLNL